jgi:uncharacterized DUF497 family protein
MTYNYSVINEVNAKYSWNPKKREQTIKERGLDFVLLADSILQDPDVVIRPDIRHSYGEDRFLAYSFVEGKRLCLCFAPREDKIHLITVFKMHKKQWETYYGKSC